METTVFYVAVAYNGGIFNPTVVEKFDNKADADSYAALMCRTKQVHCTRASNRMGRHSSRECMTLAAAERNDIRGTVSSEADFRSDTYSGTKFNN